ncbi:hypothetical protein OIU77_001665 [Salix suchowensis]|uniref:Uncharacterized protein n=1 Tax=Salix suchowensis TaxID=1278906 RepID=A0ABQ9B4C6_9ROSI|nr:hypothetical protein OIU77_001665 [Salix suchowensis]
MSGGHGIPVYKDYIVLVPQGSQSKQHLWLALHPNMEVKPRVADAILNGLEIFKLNTTDGNLAGLNPEPAVAPPPAEPKNPSLQERRAGKRSSILHVIGIVGGSIGAVIACSLIVYFLAFKQKRVKDTSKSDQEKSSWTPLSKTSRSATTISSSLPTDLCRRVDGINMEEKSSLSPHRGVMASDEDDMFSGAETCSRSTFSTDAASVTLSDPVQRARSEGVFSEIIEPKGR